MSAVSPCDRQVSTAACVKCTCANNFARSTDHPLGALLFTNHTYVNTLPLIKAANVTLQPGISMAAGWKYWLYGAGPEASTVTTMPNIDATQIALLSAEFERYTTEWMHEFAPLYTSLRYPVSQFPNDGGEISC